MLLSLTAMKITIISNSFKKESFLIAMSSCIFSDPKQPRLLRYRAKKKAISTNISKFQFIKYIGQVFGLTPLFGDRRGFMPPQLKTNKHDLAKHLRSLVMDKVDVDGNFTYCRCRGQSCNSKEDSTIKCYSTPSVNEETRPIYSIPQLQSQKFFSEESLISCPRNITQCYRSGKDVLIFSCIVEIIQDTV